MPVRPCHSGGVGVGASGSPVGNGVRHVRTGVRGATRARRRARHQGLRLDLAVVSCRVRNGGGSTMCRRGPCPSVVALGYSKPELVVP